MFKESNNNYLIRNNLKIGIQIPVTDTFESEEGVWGDEVMAIGFLEAFYRLPFIESVEILNPFTIHDNLDLIINFYPPPITRFINGPINLWWYQAPFIEYNTESLKIYDGLYDGYMVASLHLMNLLQQEINPKYIILLPMSVDPEVYKPVEPVDKYKHDIVFCGNVTAGRTYELIEDYLIPLKDYDLKIYGSGWEKFPELKENWNGIIPPKDVPKLYSSSKIVISFHGDWHRKNDVPTSRLWEALSCEAFVISDNLPMAVKLFGNNIIWTNGGNHIMKLVNYYLKHDGIRKELGKKGRELILKYHSFDHRVNEILDLYKQIIQDRLKTIELKPNKLDNPINDILLEGLNLFNSGKIEESLTIFEKIKNIDPDNAQNLLYIGTSYLLLKQYDKAINPLINSLKLDKNCIDTYNILAVVLTNIGELSLSSKFFKKILSLDPEHPTAKQSLNLIENKLKENPLLKQKIDDKYLDLLSFVETEKTKIGIFSNENIYNLLPIKMLEEKYEYKFYQLNDLNNLENDINIVIYHNDKFNNFPISDNQYKIMFINWELGSLPKKWVEKFNKEIDNIWVSSEYIKETYIKSGVYKDKISVIPPLLNLSTNISLNNLEKDLNIKEKLNKKQFKFLFVGDFNWSRGGDLLLEAYCKEFVNEEDVVLVICDKSSNTNKVIWDKIQEFSSDKDKPEIIYIKKSDEEEIYQLCNIFVYPFRVESSVLPIIKALNKGLVVITTNHPLLDKYKENKNLILIESYNINNLSKDIENEETIDIPNWYECNINKLRKILREVFENKKFEKMDQDSLKELNKDYIDEKICDIIHNNLIYIKNSEPLKIKNKQINKLIDDGIKIFYQKKFNKSLENFQQVYNLNPAHPENNFYLGSTYLLLNQNKKAIEFLNKSLSLGYKDISVYKNLAFSLKEEKDFSLALSVLNSVYNNNPFDIDLNKKIEEISLEKTENSSLSEDSKYYNLNISSYIKTPTIGLAMIVKNEENFLSNCLDSVENVVDEIVIIDTGSVDKTVEIAKNYGAKVYYYKWQNDFSLARNESIKYITSDWILIMDADEYLDKNSKKNIKSLLLKASSDIDGYLVKIVNYSKKDNDTEFIEHFYSRILRNQKGLHFHNMIHEQPSIYNKDLKLMFSEVIIHHQGYIEDIFYDRNKNQRNLEIIENAIKQYPDKHDNYYYLGQMYKKQGNYNKSTEAFQKCLKISKKIDLNYVLAYTSLLYNFILDKKIDEVIKIGEKLKKSHFFKKIPEFWVYLGMAYMINLDYDKAINCFKQAFSLRFDRVFPIVDLKFIIWLPLTKIAECYLQKKDFKNFLIYAKRSILEKLDYDLLLKIANVYFIQKDYNNSILYYTKVLENKPEDFQILKQRGKAYLYLNDIDKAKRDFEEYLSKNKYDSEVWHNLGTVYFQQNNIEKSQSCYFKALEYNQNIYESWLELAKIEIINKNFEKACNYLDKVLTINPEHQESRILKINMEREKNQNKEKISLDENVYSFLLALPSELFNKSK